METSVLKAFAGEARRQLLSEVRARLDLVLAEGSTQRREFEPVIAKLESAIGDAGGGETGRVAVVDRVAYTWFNRIIALRFMDANSYTGIGVVSPSVDRPDGQPEALVDAKRGEFDADVVASVDAQRITGLLNGSVTSSDPESEAFGLLLAAYCRFWNKSMPFMFEQNSDYTELLMPSDLLSDESVIARAVAVLTPEVCADVEVIGWLYQFYIAERKDEVFAGFKAGKKAGAAEIPAATQLFTPDWIVRYLVENSLGRLWLLNRPDSTLVDRMDYYIAPVNEETDFLKVEGPEDINVMDPACGSGHMLTYAFDLLYAMYEEDGYNPADIPSLILSRNLCGTEIDARAGALAAFALSMKARARQSSFFSKKVTPSICVLEPVAFTPDELRQLVSPHGDRDAEEGFFSMFSDADTLGALIRPDEALLPGIKAQVETLDDGSGLFSQDLFARARQVVTQAEYLTMRYQVVVANPPYMGSGSMGSRLTGWVRVEYREEKQDLYACFVSRARQLVRRGGMVALVIGDTWMTIKSFEKFRAELLSEQSFESFLHLHDVSNHPDIFGANSAFVLLNSKPRELPTPFFRLTQLGSAAKRERYLDALHSSADRDRFWSTTDTFRSVPGSPMLYWAESRDIELLGSGPRISDYVETREGLTTGDNSSFLRRWHEVGAGRIAWSGKQGVWTNSRWYLYVKGGEVRRWYGNLEYVVDWEDDGRRQIANVDPMSGRIRSHNYNGDYAFREGFTWSGLSSSHFSARYVPGTFMFDATGPMGFARDPSHLLPVIGYLNSSAAGRFLRMLSPTLHFKIGHLLSLPVRLSSSEMDYLRSEVAAAVDLGRRIWDGEETSFGFASLTTLGQTRVANWACAVQERNDRLAHELSEIQQRIDVVVNSSLGFESLDELAQGQEKSVRPCGEQKGRIESLISYAVGCIFGRYSFDEPGLILANQGDTLEEYLARIPEPSFMPDEDNVIPVLADDWFDDDIVERFRLFLRVAFGEEHFEENLRFVEESLGKDIRKYFLTDFYKDHVQRYKKRPIYWMFSSPKGTFNALIYMHRYNPSTVSTVLNEYLREFQAKLEAELSNQGRIAADPSAPTRDRARAEKESDKLRKMIAELRDYERDVLYPLASQQISIDLDDGVKANYPKFGSALKKIPGLEAASD